MRAARLAVAASLAAALVSAVGAGTSSTAAPAAPDRKAAASGSRPDPGFGPTQRATAIRAAQSAARATASVLRLAPTQALVARDVTRDADGTQHVRYERTYAGLPVVGGDLLVHRTAGGRVASAQFAESRGLFVRSTKPTVAASKAPGSGATKVVYADQHAPVLAWQSRVTGTQKDGTPIDEYVYTDATTGKRLGTRTRIYTDTGTGKSLLNGTVPVQARKVSSKFQMIDDTRGAHRTYNAQQQELDDDTRGKLFTNTVNTWGTGDQTSGKTVAVDAQYGFAKTWDFYLTQFNRAGTLNDGVAPFSRVHYGVKYDNAFWSDACFCMSYGDGSGGTDGFRPLVELDIAGHELTHGVTANTAGLDYFGDAGGLNEATSDVMGTMVEFDANNATDPGDYLLGEKVVKAAPNYLRRMDDPAADGVSLNCYTAGDTGTYDPHYSSGVGNHAFYLMAEGSGSKTINGVAYDSPVCAGGAVTGLGRDAAAKIWYRALTTYWLSTTTYPEAADGLVKAAKDLYGVGTSECTRTAAAWTAVGVEVSEPCTDATGGGSGGTNLVTDPGFEGSGWSQSSTSGDPVIVTEGTDDSGGAPAHRGTRFAYLNDRYDPATGEPTSSTDTVSQPVTIPSGGEATLSFYLLTYSSEDPHNPPIDTLKIYVGSTLVGTYSNRDSIFGDYDTYQLRKIALPDSVLGQTGATLKFVGYNNGNGAGTGFLIDDVTLARN